MKQSAAEWQHVGSSAVGEEAEVADAGKAFVAAHAVRSGAGTLREASIIRALPAVVGVVLPVEADFSSLYREQAMVGDGDAMGVARQIMQHMLRATEGRLGIHHPVLSIKSTQEEGEMLLFMKRHALAEEAQLMAGKERRRNPGDELAAEDAAEHLDGQKESGTKEAVIQREWSCASPPPGMTQWMCGCGVSVCPQVCRTDRKPSCAPRWLGIGSDVEQRGRTGLEQQGKQRRRLFWPHQRHKRMWEAEDEMIVADGQQLLLLSLGQPLIASAGLAFRAVPVAAGVIRYGLMPAAQARIAMTTEGSGTAAHDRVKHLTLRFARSTKRCTVAGSCHQ